MDAFDLMSDFEDDNFGDSQVKALNTSIITDRNVDKSKFLNENTNGKELTVPSSDVKNENSNGDYFPKNDNILGKRTSNQVDLCDLSPTTRNENEIAFEKKRNSQDLDDICS